MSKADELEAIDALQLRYIRSLDERDFAGWLDTFDAGSASYVCIAAENAERGLPLALMLDDCRERLEDRVTFIEKIWAGTFQDYQTRHFVQRVGCDGIEPGLMKVTSNFSVFFTDEQGQTAILATGVYHDRVALGGDSVSFRSKEAVMDTNVAPRYLVYPI